MLPAPTNIILASGKGFIMGGGCKFIASKGGCWLLIGKWLALNKWYSPLPEQLQESVRLNIFKSSMTWRLEIWIWWRVMSQMCSQTSRDGKPRRQCGSGRDDFFLLSGNQLLPPKAFLASCLLGSFERNGQLWHLYKIHSYICLPTNFMMLFVCYQSDFTTCMWITHLNVTHHLYCLYLFQAMRTCMQILVNSKIFI